MNEPLNWLEIETPQRDQLLPLYQGISSDWSAKGLPPVAEQPLTLLIQDPSNQTVAGIYGATYWDWFEIIALWVEPKRRKAGMASELLRRAESLAQGRGCGGAFVDTFSFQARGFYEKHGYEVFGTLPQFPGNHQRFYLRKIWAPV